MTKEVRGADIVALSLARLGCRQVFTLSGNHIMSVFDAAIEAKLDFVHVRHEAAAVHMADAFGRLTGEPGVALVTGGPGHANAVGALFTALGAESPMVLLSGHAATWELGRGGFQELRQADMAAPVAKASWTATSVAGLAGDIGEAIRIAKAGRPGPVHVSLPSDLLDARIGDDAVAWPDAEPTATGRAALSETDATAILAALARPSARSSSRVPPSPIAAGGSSCLASSKHSSFPAPSSKVRAAWPMRRWARCAISRLAPTSSCCSARRSTSRALGSRKAPSTPSCA